MIPGQAAQAGLFLIAGRVASGYATWGAGCGVQHGALARSGCLQRGPAHAGLLAQGRTQAGRSHGERELAVQAGREPPARGRRRGAEHRGGQGGRGHHRVRHLGRPGRRERRAGPGQDPRADRCADQRDDRPRGSTPHLPRRPALVRLVLRAAAGDRHRRRLARGGDGNRRGAGRDGVAAARRRPAHPGLAGQGPAVAAGGTPPAQARAGRDRQGNGGHAAARSPR